MLWLFGQIWVWLLIAFVLGAAITWVVLSSIHRKQLAEALAEAGADAEAFAEPPLLHSEPVEPAYVPAPAYPPNPYTDAPDAYQEHAYAFPEEDYDERPARDEEIGWPAEPEPERQPEWPTDEQWPPADDSISGLYKRN